MNVTNLGSNNMISATRGDVFIDANIVNTSGATPGSSFANVAGSLYLDADYLNHTDSTSSQFITATNLFIDVGSLNFI